MVMKQVLGSCVKWNRLRLSRTNTDKCTGKVVAEPYRGKPDVRFDEGA